jgi:hypothetical protein
MQYDRLKILSPAPCVEVKALADPEHPGVIETQVVRRFTWLACDARHAIHHIQLVIGRGFQTSPVATIENCKTM